MAGTKYGKYVVRHPVQIGGFGPEYKYLGEDDYNSNFTIMFLHVSAPTLMEDYPHSHDFDMYLYFIALDPDDMDDLHADIEIGLGEEREIHKITHTTSVYIPAGMIHCPLEFKRVDKPILLVHCTLASKYVKDPDRIIKD